MQIYLFLNGEQVGPYTSEQIQGMLASGAVTPETMAWYEGLPEWTPVTQVVQPTAGVSGPEDIVIEGGPPQLADGGGGEVVLSVQHQAEYSRGQLLLRTFLGVFYLILPHAVCLMFLGLAANVCSLIAWFAILFTGSYPAGIYNFVVSVHQWSMRWMARVGNLMDGYPAFGMGNKGDGVSLEIARPATSSAAALCAANFCRNLRGRSAWDLPVLSANRRLRAARGGVVCGAVYGEIPEGDARFSGGQHPLGIARDGVHHDVDRPVPAIQRETLIGFGPQCGARGFGAAQRDAGEVAVKGGGFHFVAFLIERIGFLQHFRGGANPL